MSKLIKILVVAAFMFSTKAFAALSPLGISIVPPLQFPPSDFSVTGLRASALWGKHRNVYGIDAGLLGNITELEFVGIGVSGAFNVTYGTTKALIQAAGAFNFNKQKTRIVGIQAALGMNKNVAESTVVGIQLAAFNDSMHTYVYGFQLGIFNKAQEVYGFQIGLINQVVNLHGLQIGLLNFHHNGLFAVAPLLNFGF